MVPSDSPILSSSEVCMSKDAQTQHTQSQPPAPASSGAGLQKSLKLIFVYTVATGCMFTYVSYWDSVFFSYCGAGTFLALSLIHI